MSIPNAPGDDGIPGPPPFRRRHPIQRRLMHVVVVLHRWAESGWARSATATWGFAQSSVFPGPGDALLIPLGLADPKRVFALALWATVGSSLGAFLAYCIGLFAFDSVGLPLMSLVGMGTERIQNARVLFAEHALLAVFLSCVGLVPVPVKVMSMAAGGFGVPLLPFAVVTLVGRGARYLVIAMIIRFAGSRLSNWIERRTGRPLAMLR